MVLWLIAIHITEIKLSQHINSIVFYIVYELPCYIIKLLKSAKFFTLYSILLPITICTFHPFYLKMIMQSAYLEKPENSTGYDIHWMTDNDVIWDNKVGSVYRNWSSTFDGHLKLIFMKTGSMIFTCFLKCLV